MRHHPRPNASCIFSASESDALIYRVTALGAEHFRRVVFFFCLTTLPSSTQSCCSSHVRGAIRFIIDQEYYQNRILHPVLRLAGCIPITSRRAKEAVRAAAEKIREGEIVCLFPEGQLTTIRNAVAVATRLRNNRAPAEMPGSPGLARSFMGLDFFLPGRPVFLRNGRGNSLRRAGGIRQTAFA